MKEFFKVLLKCLLIAIFLIPLGLFIWKYEINKLQLNQQKEVSDIVRTTIKEQAEKGMLLPKIVFIGANSSQEKQLSDSLINHLSSLLIEKYLKNESIPFKSINIQPFNVLTNKLDKNGNYLLSEEQLNELQSHIDFLTKQLDIEVDKVKEEVGRDIDRLNIWVSIWIGVIGFLGIFVPIVINLEVSKKASEASKKSDEAKAESEKAFKVINDNKEEIEKITGLEKTILVLKGDIKSIEKQSEDAETHSKTALKAAETSLDESTKTKFALSVVFAINNLHNLDPETLLQIRGRDNKLQSLVNILSLLHTELTNSINYFDSDLIKNCLLQLSMRIQNISYYKFINPEQTHLLNQFAEQVSNALDNYDQQHYEHTVLELHNLIINLNHD